MARALAGPRCAVALGRWVRVRRSGDRQGYWRNPELTEARFRADPENPGVKVFDTGDLGRFDPQGMLEHCGRADAQLKIRGRRVDPVEVEAALLNLGSIREAAVIGREDLNGQMRLVAYLGSSADRFPGQNALRRDLRKELPEYMVPSEFVRLEGLPRTGGGKIDRMSLAALAARPQSLFISVGGSEEDTLEHEIAAVIQGVLGKGSIDRRDDLFADLGCTSLDAARIIARLEQTVARGVSLPALFQHPTVESLAECLRRNDVLPDGPPLTLVQGGGPGWTPLFFLHGEIYGAGLYCRRLARLLGEEQPFYALNPLGFDRVPTPPTIEGMAFRFIQEIRAIQPAGPYLLAGFCNGGTVAFEMGRQLEEAGERIELLALVRAAATGRARWPGVRRLIDGAGAWLGVDANRRLDAFARVHDHLQRWRRAARNGPRATLEYARGILRRLGPVKDRGSPQEAATERGTQARAHEVFTVHYRAMLRYAPGPYGGRVLVFWPQEEMHWLHGDPSAGWRRLAPHAVSHSLPGGHETCLTIHAEVFAEHLRRYLREIPS